MTQNESPATADAGERAGISEAVLGLAPGTVKSRLMFSPAESGAVLNLAFHAQPFWLSTVPL